MKDKTSLLRIAPAFLLVGFLISVLIYAVPGVLLLLAFTGLLVVPLLLLIVLVVVIYLLRAYWPAALALILAVTLLCVLVAVPRPPDSVASITATWLQFLVVQHELQRRAAVPNVGTKGSLVLVGVDGFVPVGSRGFVYDSTGQVTLPTSARSARWQAVADHTELASSCDFTVKHLFGPYYSYFSSC